ncbi:hypothetical protein HYW73_01395 [Candidatus Nomurabacteria bacterium]|nr:hypothetical protein [Candidatus Nomurabacteria bacterium]
MKKILLLSIISLLIIPQVTLAVWWNPFTWKIFKRSSEIKIEQTTDVSSNPTKTSSETQEESSKADQAENIEKLKTEIEDLKKKINEDTTITQPKVSQEVIPTSVTSNEGSMELKIAKCKTIKESDYNTAILKINQAINDRLQEVFNSLNEQYHDAVNKVYDYTKKQQALISGNPDLTGSDKLSLITEYNNDADLQAQKIYNDQQTYWKSQKADIENSKQQAIDKINIFLSEEYNKCLIRN